MYAKMKSMKATLIGTLPPIKGISPYCLELLKSLSKNIEVEFIGFKKLYPDFLYPGGTKVIDKDYGVYKTKWKKKQKIKSSKGYNTIGYHELMIPLLYRAILEELK